MIPVSDRTMSLSWFGKLLAQLPMGRQVCSNLPTPTDQLKPEWPDLELFPSPNSAYKEKLKRHFDKMHSARESPQLDVNDPAFVSSGRNSDAVPGRVIKHS